jgi:hypothetical protein
VDYINVNQLKDRSALGSTYNKGHNIISLIRCQLLRYKQILDTGLEEAETDPTASEARLAAAVQILAEAESVLKSKK